MSAVDRFHVVVSNYNRLSCFVENFSRLRGFDPLRDRLYILDCSDEDSWREQLAIAGKLTARGLRWSESLFFIRRRNWNVNHGAQLDYIRCLRDELIPVPLCTAFMQEHYLDLERFVKEDTLPADAVYDLDAIAAELEADPKLGCVFFARYGVRVSVSNPVRKRNSEFFGDAKELLPGARRRCFCIDGGNFTVRPQLYLNWFEQRPRQLTRGNGTYGFAHAWEVRLGKILYDQHITWLDMYRGLRYASVEELDEVEAKREQPASLLWYDHRGYFFYYGRDIQRYLPLPLIQLKPYLKQYIKQTLRHPRDTRLVFVSPDSA